MATITYQTVQDQPIWKNIYLSNKSFSITISNYINSFNLQYYNLLRKKITNINCHTNCKRFLLVEAYFKIYRNNLVIHNI